MTFERPSDRAFRWFLLAAAASVFALVAALAATLAFSSRLAWSEFGARFLVSSDWDPVAESFGALPFLYGTLMSSAIALGLAVPLGLGCAIFLSEMAPRWLAETLCFFIELLAAIPSVILGLMGIFILVPMMRGLGPWLTGFAGFLPFFSGEPHGVGLLTAGCILAIMILPYITIVTRQVLLAVPRSLKEGMLALGATHWETVRGVSIPYARSGILAAVFLALGRALGETMAVTMVIGNRPEISWSWLDPSYTMAAVIANELAEAAGDLHLNALIAVGLSLLATTLLINGIARLILYRLSAPRTGFHG